MGKILHNSYTNLEARLDAFPYQKEAFEAIKDLDYSAVFHEQGLGKTKIAIDLMLYWLVFRDIDTVMIVTKKQLVRNWENELAIHTHLRPKVLTTNKKDNFFILNSATRVLLANFEVLSSEEERLSLFLRSRNVAIIVDESTKIKNPYTKLTQAFFSLSSLFKIRTIMTGTPVANRPYDIWAQIYFLDHGDSLGTDFESFKNQTDLTNELAFSEEKRHNFEQAISDIFLRIQGFSVRETKNSGIITLPKKVYSTVWCDFELKQSIMYETLKKEYRLLVTKENKMIIDESEEMLKRLLRLIQVASNPKLIDDKYEGPSGKENPLDDIINTVDQNNEYIIVWSSFIENVDFFCKKYKHLNAVKIHGKMAIEDRNKAVEVFKSGKSRVLFATPQAAKEGLTLTIANHVVFYDRGFNLDDYLQAQDRIHRISQTKTCYIYNLMIKDSIDVWLDVLLRAKQNAASLTQGDCELAKFHEEMDYSFGDLVKEVLNIKI